MALFQLEKWQSAHLVKIFCELNRIRQLLPCADRLTPSPRVLKAATFARFQQQLAADR